MGPLLDPKLYPVKVGASPETDTSRYDQPNAFLDKVKHKTIDDRRVLQLEIQSGSKQLNQEKISLEEAFTRIVVLTDTTLNVFFHNLKYSNKSLLHKKLLR